MTLPFSFVWSVNWPDLDFFLSRSFDVVLSFWQASLVGGHVKRPWDSRKLLRIVEIPRVDGVRACDEVVEYDYKIN